MLVSVANYTRPRMTVDPTVYRWYAFAQLPDPPTILALGRDAIHLGRAQIAILTKDLSAPMESWSENLGFDKE